MIDVQKISLGYGERVLFEDLSFQLGDHDKICLAGANGSGKSTLLKILCKEIQPEGGKIIVSKGSRLGYLRQHLHVSPNATVFGEAYSAFDEAISRQTELEALQTELSKRGGTEAEYIRMDFLQEELIRLEFYVAESQTRKVLAGLGFSTEQQDKPLDQFSGGWQMRVALAKVLLSQPTSLFLDEPTNHLDLESIMWLENYLTNYSGTLLLISHDRQFVDKICDCVMEIQGGELVQYSLPYSKYEEEKIMRQDQVEREYKKQQDEIKSLERFVDRFKAKASKATQAQSKQKMLDKIERIELPTSLARMRLRFPEAPPAGQWVFEVEDLDKSYGENSVFKDGKFGVKAGDKLVLVGPNGAGKSTLLRLLLQFEKPDRGTITKGHNVQVGYFAQYEEPTDQEKEMDLVSVLADAHPKISTQQIRAILGSMLFSNDDAFKKYGVLSGGERARVRLCRLLLRDCNVLVLDEPTNHLDMDSKKLLLQAVQDFTGTVIFVSHDRYFVERLATRVVLVKGGRVTEYPGDYAYYCYRIATDQGDEEGNDSPSKSGGKNKGQAEETKSSGDSRGDKKELDKQKRKAEKRLTEIEKEIEVLEASIVKLNDELCLPEVFSNGEKTREKAEAKTNAEKQVNDLYSEYAYLSA